MQLANKPLVTPIFHANRLGSVALSFLAVGLFFLAGCSLALNPDPNPDPATNPSDERPVERVTVRFRNLTQTEAVDVQFYLSPGPLALLPDDLFKESNLVRTNIGVAGTGILVPMSQDVVEFECSDDLTLGSAGGDFLDNESGEFKGTGTPRWAQNGPLNLCGHVVTFDFITVGDQFDTAIRLTPISP